MIVRWGCFIYGDACASLDEARDTGADGTV